MASQKLRCLILLILLIERNPERPLTFLTAVIDTYILNTDSLRGKDRREDRNRSRLIQNIHTEGVIPLDGTCPRFGNVERYLPDSSNIL